MTERKKVFVGIPSYDSKMHTSLASVIFRWGTKYNITLTFTHGVVPLHAARNQLVNYFLETDCEYLFFIDDDVVPPRNALDELIEADKDIIMPATLMPKKLGKDKIVPVPQCMKKRNEEDKGYVPHWGEGIVETETIGGACFLVKRNVFESKPYKFRFEYHSDGRRKKGADVAFSEDMRERGYKLYVHFDLPCSHFKEIDMLPLHTAINYLSKEKNNGFDNNE